MSSIDEQVKEAKRELSLRKAVYPKMVRAGRMSQQQADRQISLQQDIVTTLQSLTLAETLPLFEAAPTAAGGAR